MICIMREYVNRHFCLELRQFLTRSAKFYLNVSNQWFKSKIIQILRDQDNQNWMSEIASKEIYYNYRMFKNVFVSEDFLQILPPNLAYTLV